MKREKTASYRSESRTFPPAGRAGSTRFSARPSVIGPNCPSTATVQRNRSSPAAMVSRTTQLPLQSRLTTASALGLTIAAVTKTATVIRRLQTFRLLHACSGCFRLERSPGGACTRWKSAALSRRTWIPDLRRDPLGRQGCSDFWPRSILDCLSRPVFSAHGSALKARGLPGESVFPLDFNGMRNVLDSRLILQVLRELPPIALALADAALDRDGLDSVIIESLLVRWQRSSLRECSQLLDDFRLRLGAHAFKDVRLMQRFGPQMPLP